MEEISLTVEDLFEDRMNEEELSEMMSTITNGELENVKQKLEDIPLAVSYDMGGRNVPGGGFTTL